MSTVAGTNAARSSAASEVVVVTGASSGIGLAVAEAYLKRGASVVANGRDETKLHAAGRTLGERTGAQARLALVAGDIGDAATSEALVKTATTRFGKLDVVVANAGIFAARAFDAYSAAELDAFVATNLRGTMLLSQAAIRHWRAAKPAASDEARAIVAVTASIGIAPQRNLPSTIPVAIKAGINALVKALALEVASEKIRVNAVAPGIIRTPLIGAAIDQLGDAQPIGHVGEPTDVADAVVYVASAPFVTGVILPVDGGMSAGRF